MASSQSPILHPPTKKSDEVDFTPLKRHIATAYSEDPEKYSTEIATLHRLRQDTRGAGKDITGRDILYRYYGQLDLLEVRFPIDEKNIKILFTWYDAFSGKSISQYSIAYEKASIIFNIAATCASIAALQNRSEQTGQKLAFNYLQAAAGLFQYINENFLHAPSVDLSRDSIKSMVDLMLAQAQEVFLEKVIAEKKKGGLVAKLAAQAAHLYAAALDGMLTEAVKGQFDKPWTEIVKIKAKHFEAISYFHRSIQLENDAKYGECVAFATKAETLAKETHKLATSFNSSSSNFSTYVISPSLSSGSTTGSSSASAALLDFAKANLAIATERKNSCIKDNDLIYHNPVPFVDALPAIEKVAIAKPITFAEVCTNGQADVARIIGPDIFQNLIPLAVHEAASMYSEEKAKLLRADQDAVDSANEELHATLESLSLIPTLSSLKQLSRGFRDGSDETLRMPKELATFAEEIRTEEGSPSSTVEGLLNSLEGLKKQAREVLDEIGLLLDKEQFECEQQRAKYAEKWTQEPSAKYTSQIRQDVKQNRTSYEAAARTDQALYAKIAEAKRESDLLRRPVDQLESIFAELILNAAPANLQKPSGGGTLIDDPNGPGGSGEQSAVDKIEGMLNQLRSLKAQRVNLVAELKTKIHEDDIAGTLVLNKNRENQVFQTELAKFQPLRAQITANLQGHSQILSAVTSEFEKLKESSKSLRLLDIRARRRTDIIKDWTRSYNLWRESREGLRKGLRFYTDLNDLLSALKGNAVSFVNRRNDERADLIKRIEEQSALSGQQALREQLAKLSMSSPTSHQPPAASSYYSAPMHPGSGIYGVPGSQPRPPAAAPYTSYPTPAAAAPSNYPPYGAQSSAPPPAANPYPAAGSYPYNPAAPPAAPPGSPGYQPYPAAQGYHQPPAAPAQPPPQHGYSQAPGGYPSQAPPPAGYNPSYSAPAPAGGYGGYPAPPTQAGYQQPNYANIPVGAPGYAAPAPNNPYGQQPPQQNQWKPAGGSLLD
ncbi:bck1-like resistance to osmotic shock [Phlyctochytrium bullatum]|nr:bck1-like resistance to osmotic shock [Phlyctochytrium bullatum]